MSAIISFGLAVASIAAGMMASAAACAVNQNSTARMAGTWLARVLTTVALAWFAGWFAHG